MISIYKKYHIAYWCIGIFLLICMFAIMTLFWKEEWYFPFLVLIPTLFLVVVNAKVFTRLATKKLSNEVIVLINECRANDYINALKSLFDKKQKVLSSIHTMCCLQKVMLLLMIMMRFMSAVRTSDQKLICPRAAIA